MASHFKENVFWDEKSKIDGVYANVETRRYVFYCCFEIVFLFSISALSTSSKEWFNTTYHVWTHPSYDYTENEKVFICVHGLARNAHDFDYISQRILATIPNSKVVCVDMPGRGTSEWIKSSEYTYPVYINVLCSVLASIGSPKEVYWIGISMGGLIGISMFNLENCPIKKMVLVDIGPFVKAETLKRISTYVKARPSFDTMDEFKNYVKNIYNQFGNLTNEDWEFMAKMLVKVEKVNEKEKYTFHYDPNIVMNIGEDVQDLNLWHIWKKIKIDILVLRGKLSDVLLKETANQMLENGSNIKIVEFDDCGHTPHLFTEEKCEPILKFFMSN